jgi:hypothetical protein
MEGKLQWFSGLLSKFLGKSGQNPENTESWKYWRVGSPKPMSNRVDYIYFSEPIYKCFQLTHSTVRRQEM